MRAAQVRYQRPRMLTVSFQGPGPKELRFQVELTAEDPAQAWQQVASGLNEILAFVDGGDLTDAWELKQLQIES